MPNSPPKHRPTAWLAPEIRSLQAERARGSSTDRGYDADWRRLRRVILARDPLCIFCLARDVLTASEHVDHIIPIAERPDLRLVASNLRGLCAPCHNRHTAAQLRM